MYVYTWMMSNVCSQVTGLLCGSSWEGGSDFIGQFIMCLLDTDIWYI